MSAAPESAAAGHEEVSEHGVQRHLAGLPLLIFASLAFSFRSTSWSSRRFIPFRAW